MAFKLNTNISDSQAEKMGARVTREQFERYMNEFAPVERSLIGSLGSGDAAKAAERSTADAERARASLERMRSRYGTSLTADQRSAEDAQFASRTTLNSLGTRNLARQLDEDRDFNLRGTLLNIGNNLSSSAMGGLTDSSNNAAARNNAHNAAMADYQAQRSSQKAQTASTIATLGALAFAI